MEMQDREATHKDPLAAPTLAGELDVEQLRDLCCLVEVRLAVVVGEWV